MKLKYIGDRSSGYTFQFFKLSNRREKVLFSSPSRLCLFHYRAHVYHFFFFSISLLDAFNFADTNTMQDVSRIIYETRTELVHSRESLSQSVGTRNPKVWDLIPRGKSKFSFSYACNEAQKRFYSFSLADTFFNILLNISSQLLENLCVMPTIRGTKIYTNNLPSLRNVAGNLNAYFKKCSLSKEKNLN